MTDEAALRRYAAVRYERCWSSTLERDLEVPLAPPDQSPQASPRLRSCSLPTDNRPIDNRPILLRTPDPAADLRPKQSELAQLLAGLTSRDVAILAALDDHRYLDQEQVRQLFFAGQRHAQIRTKWLREQHLIQRWTALQPLAGTGTTPSKRAGYRRGGSRNGSRRWSSGSPTCGQGGRRSKRPRRITRRCPPPRSSGRQPWRSPRP